MDHSPELLFALSSLLVSIPHLESHWRWNSAHDCTAFHCTEPFINILPLSPYDLNNVERGIKHQLVIVICQRQQC